MSAREGGSETERGTNCDHPRILSEASVAVQDAAAGTNDVLQFRLKRPPRRQLRLVDHLDHGFSAAHRIEEVAEQSDVGIETARIVADARIGGGDPDLVVGSARDEAFVEEAAVGVEADQIAIVRYAAHANEPRQALVVAAGNTIEHLIDDAVDAGVSGVVERNAGRQRIRQRAAGIVVALIAEARAGVIPRADAVGARKPAGVLALVGQITGFRDEERTAAEAEHRAGRKRRALIGAVAPAGIAAEHGGLQHHVLGRLDADANTRSGKRIGRSPGWKIGGKKHRPADAVVDEVRSRLALEKLAVRRHETGANGQAVVEDVLLIPKRIEPRDWSRFEIRHGQNTAEISRTEKRPMGDETMSVKSASLPSRKLV